MKNTVIASAIVCFNLIAPAVYAGGNEHQPPPSQPPQQQDQGQHQGQGQDQQAIAGSKSVSNATVDNKVILNNVGSPKINVNVPAPKVTVNTPAPVVHTGPTTSSAAGGAGGKGGAGGEGGAGGKGGSAEGGAGGNAAGGDAALEHSGNGTGTGTGTATVGDTGNNGNGNGAKVDTTNNSSSRFLYVNLPTMPPVAPTVTGTGAIAVTSACGPLMEKVREPIQYLIVGHFGTKTITLKGQDTDVLKPVMEGDKAKEFEVLNNRDGSISEMGTIYTEAAIVISSSVSKQFGLGVFGGSGGGSASNGVAGTITGTERIIAVGRCEYRRYQLIPVAAVDVKKQQK